MAICMEIKVTDNEILNNILNHMKIKGVRQTDVARYLGISDNAVSQWKTKTSKSYMKYLDQLADYFDVTRDELIHTDKKKIYEHHLSIEEQSLLEQYRLLPDDVKKKVTHLIGSINMSCNIR